jgi:hypothetical protein
MVAVSVRSCVIPESRIAPRPVKLIFPCPLLSLDFGSFLAIDFGEDHVPALAEILDQQPDVPDVFAIAFG